MDFCFVAAVLGVTGVVRGSGFTSGAEAKIPAALLNSSFFTAAPVVVVAAVALERLRDGTVDFLLVPSTEEGILGLRSGFLLVGVVA